MKVFISWSGEQSRQVALALRDWLPQTLQAATPYMSQKENEAGTLWDRILSTALEESNFGIVCLTPSNLESRWLNFEAGALSKAVSQARVVPLLYGLTEHHVGLPLSRFMMKQANKEGVRDTVLAINGQVEADRRLPEDVLSGTFESLWPKLRQRLDAVVAGPEARRRSDRELLEEILELIRGSRSRPTVGFSGEGTLNVGAIGRSVMPVGSTLWNLRRIAGPNGSVGVVGEAITVKLPSLNELSERDRLMLDGIAAQFQAQGMELRVIEESNG